MIGRFSIIALFVYGLLVTLAVAGMKEARRTALQDFSTPAAGADWQRWRDAAREQSEGAGPVTRRVPASDEPPALVLLRDYYGMCLAAVLGFGSLSYAVLVFLFRGAISSQQPVLDPEAPRLLSSDSPTCVSDQAAGVLKTLSQ